MSAVDFMSYYNAVKNHEDDDFTVEDVFMRRDANFMQGFYYDITWHQFVESAGLYGVSKVEWLKEDEDDAGVEVQDTKARIYELDDT